MHAVCQLFLARFFVATAACAEHVEVMCGLKITFAQPILGAYGHKFGLLIVLQMVRQEKLSFSRRLGMISFEQNERNMMKLDLCLSRRKQ